MMYMMGKFDLLMCLEFFVGCIDGNVVINDYNKMNNVVYQTRSHGGDGGGDVPQQSSKALRVIKTTDSNNTLSR